jgi:hypothetical protein
MASLFVLLKPAAGSDTGFGAGTGLVVLQHDKRSTSLGDVKDDHKQPWTPSVSTSVSNVAKHSCGVQGVNPATYVHFATSTTLVISVSPA